MATLTKDRAKAPLLNNANINIRKQLSAGDWEANTFSFDLHISAPWTDDAEARKRSRDYKVRMTAGDALQLATTILTAINKDMDLVLKAKR